MHQVIKSNFEQHPQDEDQVHLSEGLEHPATPILIRENSAAILTETRTAIFNRGAPYQQMWGQEKALETSMLHTTHFCSAAGSAELKQMPLDEKPLVY